MKTKKDFIFKVAKELFGIKKEDFIFHKNFLDCNSCKLQKKFCDFGLTKENIAFLINVLIKNNVPREFYCVDKIKHEYFGNIIKFCYNEEALPVLEKAIKNLDFFQAICRGFEKGLLIFKEKKKYLKHDNIVEIKEKIINRSIKDYLKKRKKMWWVIDGGIKRLFPKKTNLNIINALEQEGVVNPFPHSYSLHGHQLKQLIKNNQYYKFLDLPKTITIGHFHLLMAIKRNNTLIIFSGHFLKNRKSCFSQFFISHLGFSHLNLNQATGEIVSCNFIRCPDFGLS